MKVKIWKISGYKGHDNYDGPSDDNIEFYVAMDYRFTKEMVENVFFNHFGKKHKTVAIKAEFIAYRVVENSELWTQLYKEIHD